MLFATLIRANIYFLPYSLKFLRLKIFHRFRGSERSCKKFLPQNFRFITDARSGWKLDHENFIHKNLFFEQILANHEISLENFRLYSRYQIRMCVDFRSMKMLQSCPLQGALKCYSSNSSGFAMQMHFTLECGLMSMKYVYVLSSNGAPPRHIQIYWIILCYGVLGIYRPTPINLSHYWGYTTHMYAVL